MAAKRLCSRRRAPHPPGMSPQHSQRHAVERFPRLKRIALAATIVAGTTTLSTGAIAGSASAACASRTTFQAFSKWGDTNQYFVAPNATFESGTSGWTMYAGVGTPSVVTDQEPWKINGAGHSKALQLPAYSTAMPPNICLNSNEEWMRFFYKDPAVSGAQLLVKIEAWSSAGRVVQEIRINSGSAGWKVSNQIAMPNKRDAAGEQTITLTITPVGTAATWRVDDIMIDPWVSR